MKISPLVFIIVGAVVAIWSFMIGKSFSLFLYVGVGFIIYGIARLAFGIKKSDGNKPSTVHHGQTHHIAVPPTLRQSFFVCPRCRASMSPAAHFCMMCGLRFR